MLVYFNNLYKLRNVEKENSELVSSFLFDAVENYIVRFDSHIIARYPEYKLDNKQQMIRALKSIEYLTEYYIRRFLLNKILWKILWRKRGLAKKIA